MIVFKAIISNFKDVEQFDNVRNIITSIARKDETLRYNTDADKLEIYIFDADKDILHRRCTWIIHKLDEYKRLIYDITEFLEV